MNQLNNQWKTLEEMWGINITQEIKEAVTKEPKFWKSYKVHTDLLKRFYNKRF